VHNQVKGANEHVKKDDIYKPHIPDLYASPSDVYSAPKTSASDRYLTPDTEIRNIYKSGEDVYGRGQSEIYGKDVAELYDVAERTDSLSGTTAKHRTAASAPENTELPADTPPEAASPADNA
jgi:hypothetical protein